MAEITKEKVDALNARIAAVNEKRVEYKTKAEMAKKSLEELSNELGQDLTSKTPEELLKLADELEAQEQEKFNEIEKKVIEAEKLLNIN